MRLRCSGQRRREPCWRGWSASSSREKRTSPWRSAPSSDASPPHDAGSWPAAGCAPPPCFARACARDRAPPAGPGERSRPSSAAAGIPTPRSPGPAPLSVGTSARARVRCGRRSADQPAARRVRARPVRPPPLRRPRPGPSGPGAHAGHAGHVEQAGEACEEDGGAAAPRRVRRGRPAESAGHRPRRQVPGRHRAGRPRPRSRTHPLRAAAHPRRRAAPRVPGRPPRWARAPREAPASLEEAV